MDEYDEDITAERANSITILNLWTMNCWGDFEIALFALKSPILNVKYYYVVTSKCIYISHILNCSYVCLT